jgi:hypothetical protein
MKLGSSVKIDAATYRIFKAHHDLFGTPLNQLLTDAAKLWSETEGLAVLEVAMERSNHDNDIRQVAIEDLDLSDKASTAAAAAVAGFELAKLKGEN